MAVLKYVSGRDTTSRVSYTLVTEAGAEIKTAYEGESNTNAYTDTEKTALSDIISLLTPPAGKYKIANLYVDPSTGTLTVKYEDTPV